MQHRPVLDIGALADEDLIVLGADHDFEPHAHLGFENDRAYDGGVVSKVVMLAAQLDAALADGEQGHGAMIIE